MNHLPLNKLLVSTYNGHFELPGLVCVTTPGYSLSSFAILILDGIVIGTVYRKKPPA